MHKPVHAGWLNQFEIYLSEQRLLDSNRRCEEIAIPLKWKFIKDDLNQILFELTLTLLTFAV